MKQRLGIVFAVVALFGLTIGGQVFAADATAKETQKKVEEGVEKVKDAYDEHAKGFISRTWTYLEGVRTKINTDVTASYNKKLATKEETDKTVAKEREERVDDVLEGEKATLAEGASDRVHSEQVFQSIGTWALRILMIWSGSQILFYGVIILVILVCIWAVKDKIQNEV